MKIFDSLWRDLGFLGINQPKMFHQNPFNKRNLVSVVALVMFAVSAIGFLIFEAETFDQYSESFYVVATSICYTECCLALVWKRRQIFQLTTDFETIIEKRNKNIRLMYNFFYLLLKNYVMIISGLENPSTRAIYGKANEKANNLADWYYIVLMKITTPGCVVPSCVVTIFFYFTSDTKSEIYNLPFPVWYEYELNYDSFDKSNFF